MAMMLQKGKRTVPRSKKLVVARSIWFLFFFFSVYVKGKILSNGRYLNGIGLLKTCTDRLGGDGEEGEEVALLLFVSKCQHYQNWILSQVDFLERGGKGWERRRRLVWKKENGNSRKVWGEGGGKKKLKIDRRRTKFFNFVLLH